MREEKVICEIKIQCIIRDKMNSINKISIRYRKITSYGLVETTIEKKRQLKTLRIKHT